MAGQRQPQGDGQLAALGRSEKRADRHEATLRAQRESRVVPPPFVEDDLHPGGIEDGLADEVTLRAMTAHGQPTRLQPNRLAALRLLGGEAQSQPQPDQVEAKEAGDGPRADAPETETNGAEHAPGEADDPGAAVATERRVRIEKEVELRRSPARDGVMGRRDETEGHEASYSHSATTGATTT